MLSDSEFIPKIGDISRKTILCMLLFRRKNIFLLASAYESKASRSFAVAQDDNKGVYATGQAG
jgi:hypothetical protein